MNREQMPKLEELDKVLNHPAIKNVEAHGGEYLQRCRTFTVRGTTYTIEWYENVMTIYIGNAEIRADGLEVSRTWPNRSDLNLQFCLRGVPCMIVPLEPWEEQ